MRIKYTPVDQPAKEWDFDPARVKFSICELIEKRAGTPYEQWVAAVQGGKARARKVLLWFLLARDLGFTLRFEDTPDPEFGELSVEHSARELLEMRQQVLSANLDAGEKEQALAHLDGALGEALMRESTTEQEVADAPKAL